MLTSAQAWEVLEFQLCIKYISFCVWVHFLVWNFKGMLWPHKISCQRIESGLYAMVKFYELLDIKSSQAFLKQLLDPVSAPVVKWYDQPYECRQHVKRYKIAGSGAQLKFQEFAQNFVARPSYLRDYMGRWSFNWKWPLVPVIDSRFSEKTNKKKSFSGATNDDLPNVPSSL